VGRKKNIGKETRRAPKENREEDSASREKMIQPDRDEDVAMSEIKTE
jgi:hypothetical protein